MTLAADQIIGLYARHADVWVKQRGVKLTDTERSHLENFAGAMTANGAILDLGCGSGQPVAEWLIAQGFRLTGVDTSPSLITRCRTAFPEHEWRLEDMRGLDLGRRFDGVLAWFSSFHLTAAAQAGMAAVYARHLRPGGVLMFISGPERGVAIATWMGEPLFHASQDPSEYRADLEACGLVDIKEVSFSPGGDDATRVWTARRSVSDYGHERQTE